MGRMNYHKIQLETNEKSSAVSGLLTKSLLENCPLLRVSPFVCYCCFQTWINWLPIKLTAVFPLQLFSQLCYLFLSEATSQRIPISKAVQPQYKYSLGDVSQVFWKNYTIVQFYSTHQVMYLRVFEENSSCWYL